jgi:predicted phosphodiesterase
MPIMERKKKPISKHVDAILCSDIHLREDTPVCRTDDFPQTQWRKMKWLRDLQQKYNCPVWHGGDLFHHWKTSPSLLTATMNNLPNLFCTVYGNHDLPQHNIQLSRKSGLYTLWFAEKLKTFLGTNWGGEVYADSGIEVNGRRILIWHVFTYQGKEPWPGCTSPTGSKLLRKYPQFDLILTGDNHKPFVEEHNGRLLVNPGSLMRQRASESHKPRIYLYHSLDNTVTPVYVPIDEGVITIEHLEKKKQRDGRIDAFISKLNDDWESSLSFEENLKRFIEKNKTDKKVVDIIMNSISI